jgi:hypothetical protein
VSDHVSFFFWSARTQWSIAFSNSCRVGSFLVLVLTFMFTSFVCLLLASSPRLDNSMWA